MSSRSASALLDAALAVPFDPEEEDRRQLALAAQAQWETGPLPDQQLNIAPEAVDLPPAPMALAPDPLIAEADAAMAGGLDANGEPPLPVAQGSWEEEEVDEPLPPVQAPVRRSAAALLADVADAGQRTAGPAVPTGEPTPARRSASALLADLPDEAAVNVEGRTILGTIGDAFKRGWTMGDLAREMEAPQPNADRVFALQQEMQKLPPSPEYVTTMRDDVSPAESWQAFKSNPVGVLGELMGESLAAFGNQMIEKAPNRVAIGLGAGAAMGAPVAGIGAVPGGFMGAGAGFAQASGAASYALEMSSGILEALEKSGVPMDDPQAMRAALADPERMQVAREFAQRKAVPIAIFDGGSALIAGRLGGKPASALAKVGEGFAETFLQGAMGAAGEASGQLAQSGEIRSARAILAEGVAEVPTGLAEIGAGALTQNAADANRPTGTAPAAAAPAPSGVQAPWQAAREQAVPTVTQVEVVGDDVFGEPTTAAVERPVATGDERFAPPVEAAAPAPAAAGTTASVPMMITRQMEADLLARGISQQEINAMTPQQANEILAAAGQRTAGPAVPTGETTDAGDGAATAEPRTDLVQNRTNRVQNRTNAGQTVTNRVETATNAVATAEPTVKPPKKLYRGEAPNQWDPNVRGMGTFALGKGRYSTTDKKFARMYGEVKEVSPDEYWPRNPLVLPGTGDAAGLLATYIARNTNFRNMREFNAAYPDPGQFVREQGFDGIIAGNEVVKYADEAPAAASAAEAAAATGETASGVDEATNQNYGGINEVGISENASRGDAANPLESAASFTRSRAEAIRAASPSRKGFSAEFEALLEWGQREGVVTDQAPVQGEAASKGREHEVWLAPEGRVFKATYPQQFGLALSRDGKATPVQYLERIALNNEFFGDAIRIERLWNENGRLRVVTSQPFVNGQAASDQQIESFFNDLGFTKQKRGDREFFYNEAEGVVAFDTHGGNVLNVDGKVIPIDVGMQRVTPELAAALDLTAPSTADAQAATTARRNIQRKLRPDAGAIDLSIVEDLVEYGRTIYRAGMDYATWAAAMTREFGQAVAQFLRQAFDRIVAAYQASRFSDTTGAVGDVRPKAKPRQFEAKARQNEALAPETRARLGSEYIPISLNAQAEAAKEWINTNGLEAAKLRIAQLSGNDTVPTPVDFAIGIESAGRLSATGDHAGAAGIVSTMSQRATSLGQTISVLAMMARLTPEGIVLYGQNIVSRYINTLPQEAQDRIKALQAEVDRLRTALAEMKFKEGSEVIRSGKLGDEKIQDRIKRRVKARVQADLGPAAAGPEVTAETKARTQGLNRQVRDVLLSDGKQSEMVKQITQILTSEGNMPAAEAEAVGKSIVAAFTKIVTETRRNYVQGAKRGSKGLRKGNFDKLLKMLAEQKDMTDAEFLGQVSRLMGVPGMTAEMARELKQMAQRYERATDPDVKMALGGLMLEQVHEIVPADFWVKVRAFSYLSMLFAPKTWIRNVLGNQVQWIADIGRDAFVTGVMDPLMSIFTGKRTSVGVNLGPRLKGLVAPIADVRRGYMWSKKENPTFNFRQNLMQGVNHLRVLSRLTTQNKFEISDLQNVGGRIFSSRFMRLWEGALSIALGAGDRAFYMSAFRAAMARIQRAAIKNGEWTGQPTPEMVEAAMAEAMYAIYQNPNVLSRTAGEVRGWINYGTTGGRTKQFGLGTGLMAFTQVPGSLSLRGLIDWSPVGFIQALYRGMRGILYATTDGRIGAKFDQAAFNKEFTQALIGSGGFYAAGFWLYSIGVITASMEDDEDLEAMRRASGLGAYRINLTALRRALFSGNWFTRQEPQDGDLIMSYDWIQPVAITVAAGAEYAALLERADRNAVKKGLAERASMPLMSLVAGAKSLEELPLLSGLMSFMGALGRKAPEGESKLGNAIVGTVTGMPSMFVPQLVRQVTQLSDNMIRTTRAGRAEQREFDRLIASIPGWSTKYPVRFDVMGEAMERYQYGENTAFNVLINPALTRRYKADPVLQEIGRLMNATGDAGPVPRQVARKAKINGVAVELTNEQIAAYQYYVGNFTMSHFRWRMAAPVYARLPDEVKAKMLAQDLTDIHAAVKSAALGADPRRLTRNQMFLRQALVNSPLGQSVPPR